jgi:membrane protein implicated in regulation of membrane protease activity
MAFPAGSMLYLRMWTRQRCVGCGTLYRYLLRKAVPARFAAPEASIAEVEVHYAKFQANGWYCPCPRCGRVQPNMIALRQDSDYFMCGIGGGCLLALVFVMNLMGGKGPVEVLIAGTAAVLTLASVLLLWSTLKNRQGSPEANQRLMARELERGRVEVLEEGKGPLAVVSPTGNGKKALAFGVLTGGILLTLLPLALPVIPVWLTQLAAAALFVWAVYILSASVKRMKNSGAELALDEVTSQLVETDEIPKDFRDFVKETGHFKADRPAT